MCLPTPSTMPGIDPQLLVHQLNIREGYRSIKQKLRHQGAKRSVAANEEVKKLLAAGFIRECQYTEWLANIVLVQKQTRAWKMCVDFTDLNKACPKEDFPLPKIYRLVDSRTGHALFSFIRMRGTTRSLWPQKTRCTPLSPQAQGLIATK